MRCAATVCAVLVVLSVAGCGSATGDKVAGEKAAGDKVAPDKVAAGNVAVSDNERTATADEQEAATDEGTAKRSIIGKWNVSLVAAPEPPDRLAGALFNLRDEFDIAIKGIVGGERIDDPELFHWLKIEAEFHPDGKCSLRADNLHREGTWTLDGQTLIQSYQSQPGEAAALAWVGLAEFTLRRPERPILAFVRQE